MFDLIFLHQLQALYDRCDRLRPSLFRLASDTMDDDEALTQILAANDELTLSVNAYKELLGRGSCNGRQVRNKSEEDSSRSICRSHIITFLVLKNSLISCPSLLSFCCFISFFLFWFQLQQAQQPQRATTLLTCQLWNLQSLTGKLIFSLNQNLLSFFLLWRILSSQVLMKTSGKSVSLPSSTLVY